MDLGRQLGELFLGGRLQQTVGNGQRVRLLQLVRGVVPEVPLQRDTCALEAAKVEPLRSCAHFNP